MPVSRPSALRTTGKMKGLTASKNCENHRAAHHIAEQADSEGKRARKLANDVERQHDRRRLEVRTKIANQPRSRMP